MVVIEEHAFPVVCMREYYIVNNGLDTTIFFTFDARFNEYVLWGKRGVKKDDPFMFRFKRFKDMYNFIDTCLLRNNTYKCKEDDSEFTLVLYNYNNFPMDFDVSYDFLYENMDESYEITGYDKVNVKVMTKSYLRKWGHICRYSYNRIDDEIV